MRQAENLDVFSIACALQNYVAPGKKFATAIILPVVGESGRRFGGKSRFQRVMDLFFARHFLPETRFKSAR